MTVMASSTRSNGRPARGPARGLGRTPSAARRSPGPGRRSSTSPAPASPPARTRRSIVDRPGGASRSSGPRP